MRRSIATWLGLGVGLVLLSTVVVIRYSVYQGSSVRTPPASKSEVATRELVIALPTAPVSLDPLRLTDVATGICASAVHAPLAIVGSDGALQFILAESIAMSPDAMACTIRLRDARFSDGTQVKASDVVFSYRRSRAHPQAGFILQRLRDAPDDFRIVDDRSLVANFRLPEPDFPKLLSTTIMSVVSESSSTTNTQPLDARIIGSGPYSLKRAVPGSEYVFARNPGYPLPVDFETITVRVLPYEQAQLSGVADGTLDLVQVRGPFLGEVAERRADGSIGLRPRFSHLRLVASEANELVIAFLNFQRGARLKAAADAVPRGDFFKRLYTSIDRTEIAESLYLGTAVSAYGVVPPGYGGPTEPLFSSATTLASAELELLAANDADSRRIAQLLQTSLLPTGFALEPNFVDLATLAERLLAGEAPDVGVLWLEMNVASSGGALPWSVFFLPDNPFSVLGEPIDGFAERISTARGTLDETKRIERYRSAMNYVDERQTTWIPIVSRKSVWLASDSVRSHFLDVNGQLRLPLLHSANR